MRNAHDLAPTLNRVRKLIERAQEIPNLTDAERSQLKNCWTAHASIEVPLALQRLRSIEPPQQHEVLPAAFLDEMQTLIGRVEEVVNAHEEDGAPQAHGAITECKYTQTLLDVAKADLQMQDHIESSRFQ